MCMQAWCCPSSKLPSLMPFPERIHLQQPFSLGLSLISKVAGGSGWLCPTPHPGPKAMEVGAELMFILFHVWNRVYCSPESKHFAEWLHARPPGLMKPHSKSPFTQWQHQASVASPQLGPVCPLCQSRPLLSLVLGDGQVSHLHRLSRLVVGGGLWNSKAQKAQWALAFLCLNLPPTTLLPSSSVRCSLEGTQG